MPPLHFLHDERADLAYSALKSGGPSGGSIALAAAGLCSCAIGTGLGAAEPTAGRLFEVDGSGSRRGCFSDAFF